MIRFEPDFTRHIDVPGTGPCRRPVDIDKTSTGFSTLASLRVYSFDDGMVINGEAESDEVFIVVMRGRAALRIEGTNAAAADFVLDARNVCALYMPPHAIYRLSAETDCDVAYARVKARGGRFPEPCAFTALDGDLHVADHAVGMTLAIRSVAPGDTMILGTTPTERFVHARSDHGGSVDASGTRLADWQSAAFEVGEQATLRIEGENVDVLTVAASAR